MAVLLPLNADAGPWRQQSAQSSDPQFAQWPRALVDNDKGATLTVFRNEKGAVFIEFTTVAPDGLARSSCPTFQIDTRTPVHFYALGADCTVSGKAVRYSVAQITDARVESLALHRLLNGNRLEFRYLTQGGNYQQSVFSLRQSKQAMLGALGETLKIAPGDSE
jgi:hypothetical protein